MTRVVPRAKARLAQALDWRVRQLFGDARMDHWLVGVAKVWRPRLKNPRFIGITGSAGKTTTKELLLGVLSYKSRGIANPGTLNVLPEVAKTILRVRPKHAFCIAELTEDRPGVMDEQLALLQPSIGIVTIVQSDHVAAYSSVDGIALEMQKLIASLPADGFALLNADDPRVLAMAASCRATVITFGVSQSAQIQAENVSASWPERLQMTVVRGLERVPVVTQLCGTHWVPSVLGAIGAGLATGMTLQECAAAIASVAPFEGRMQPVTTPDGVSFIRDDLKAPLWTIPPALQFLREATAKRKIAIIGSISDYEGNSKRSGSLLRQRAYTSVATEALEIADHVIFIGPQATKCLKAKRHVDDDALQAFYSVEAARDYLQDLLQPGDLVLLKGTQRQECLADVIGIFSNETGAKRQASERPRAEAISVAPPNAQAKPHDAAQTKPVRAIVGLGNAGEQFRNTRHNVGFHALDAFAQAKGVAWQQSDLGDVAT